MKCWVGASVAATGLSDIVQSLTAIALPYHDDVGSRYTLLWGRLEAVNEEIDSPDQKPQSPSAPTASFAKSFRAVRDQASLGQH